jgi:hypothetical protein
MRCYSHLSDDEREQIGLAKTLGRSIAAIAQAIGRPKSTVWLNSPATGCRAGATRRLTPPEPINCAGGLKPRARTDVDVIAVDPANEGLGHSAALRTFDRRRSPAHRRCNKPPLPPDDARCETPKGAKREEANRPDLHAARQLGGKTKSERLDRDWTVLGVATDRLRRLTLIRPLLRRQRYSPA